MKKLIMMVAVAMTAVVVNAANCDWGIDVYSFGSSDEYWDGKTYYAINGDASNYIKMLTDGKVEDFTKALGAGGTFDEYSYGYAGGTMENAAGSISVIALTDGTKADSTFYYATLDTTGFAYDPGMQSPGTLTFSADATPSPWSTATVGAVPEPTSGLLLLIGVAGLALRRRRA